MSVLRNTSEKGHWLCQQILRRNVHACTVCQFNIIVRMKKQRKKKATALPVFNSETVKPAACIRAGGGTRTHTPSRTADFESASSAIPTRRQNMID